MFSRKEAFLCDEVVKKKSVLYLCIRVSSSKKTYMNYIEVRKFFFVIAFDLESAEVVEISLPRCKLTQTPRRIER